MIVVRFSDPAEFCAELERDGERITRGIVRVTRADRPSPFSAGISRVSVLATARVDDTIVRLEAFVGEDWGPQFATSTKVLARAGEVMARIEQACERLGLDARAGILVEEDRQA